MKHIVCADTQPDRVRMGIMHSARSPLSNMIFVFEARDAEQLLRKAHINILSFYLMGPQRDNFIVFNIAAARVLADAKIRGRRRQLIEKFIGKVAGMRLAGKLKMEEDISWQD